MRQRKFILTLAVTCFSVAATALDKLEVGPAPAWVQPAPASVPAGPDSAAAVRVLLNDQQLRFTPEAVEIYFDNRILIQTPQGLQAVGTIALAWQPDADVVTVHRLVVRREGQVRDLLGNAEDFTILRREDMLAQATLTGTLTAILQPSDLQVGDIVEFAYTRRHADPVVPDRPDMTFAWRNAPVQNVRFRAQWPAQMPIRWQLRDFKPALQESSSGGTRSISFTMDNPSPLLQPSGAPARYTALRRIEFTTFQSWAEVSKRFGPLYAQSSTLSADSPLRAEIARIRSASTDAKTRAAAALRLVQDQIRYVLLAMNSGALVPATADQTWQRRYGDCKAKTALLIAVLRELDIEAEAVAVNSAMGDGIDGLLPAISAFDHVLVRARIAGRTYWLDGTRLGDRNVDQLQVPAFHWGLPLTATGSELVRMERTALNEPQLVQEMDLDASAGVDAPAPFRGKVVFRGDGAKAMRFSLDNMDVTQRDQGLRSYWRDNFDDLQVTKVASSFDEPSGSLTLTAEGTLRMDWIEEKFFEIEGMRLGFDADFTRPENTDAEAPYVVAFPDYSVYRATVKLPAGKPEFSISGENINQTLAGWEYKRAASVINAVFRAESSMRSIVPEVSAKEARAAETGLRRMYDSVLYLTKPPPLPTADELRSQAGKPLESADAYNDRGADMMDRSLYELAIVEFTSAIKLAAGNVYAWRNRGMSHLSLRRYGEAQADLRKALELDPGNAHTMRNLGSVTLELGQTADAIVLFGKSLEIEEDSWTRERRARAHLAAGDAERAAQDLVAISRSDPARTSHFESRVADLLRANREDDVRILARAALDAQAGPSGGALIASRLYFVTGDAERARTILGEAIRKAPAPLLYVRLAMIESTPEKARATVDKALELDPEFAPALSFLVGMHRALGNHPDVMKSIDRLEAASGPTAALHQARAETLVRMGDTARAKESYGAARSIARGSADLNNLCWSQASNNVGLEDALKDCESAVALQPDCAPCLDSHGFVLLRLGRNEDAIAAYDKTLVLNSEMPTSFYGRGIARLRLGRKEAGDADLAAARKLESFVAERFASYGVER